MIKSKKKIAAIIVIIAVIVIAAVLLLINSIYTPEPDDLDISGVIVPWNPGGTADLVTRMLINQTAPDTNVRNVNGAIGTLGLNEVYAAPHDGKTLLGTNLSAFVTAEYMGFSTHGYDEWEIWLPVYAPCIVAVKADSPYKNLDDLLKAAGNSSGNLICANSGNGTLGFIAAHLFSDRADVKVKHDAHSGSNPAINSVVKGESDFIVALSSELIEKLRSGELRALAGLSEGMLNFEGVNYHIPPVTDTVENFKHVLPFGECYGIMLPKGLSEDALIRYDRQFSEACSNENFLNFLLTKGILPVNYNRKEATAYSEKFESLICWILYDTGCVNISPETVGIVLS